MFTTTLPSVPGRNYTIVGAIVGIYSVNRAMFDAVKEASNMGANGLIDIKVLPIHGSTDACLLSATAVNFYEGELVQQL